MLVGLHGTQAIEQLADRKPCAAAALPGQHGSDEGHLLGNGAFGKIELVGQLEVTQTPDLVADVAAYGNYAYLANWGEPDCSGPEKGGVNTPDAGAWVIDISDPASPEKVNFIAMPQDTRPGEGMQVTHVETPKFTGDVLVMNAEACGKNYKGGFMLYDVTNPLKPVKLKEGFGDRTGSDAHQTHSAFVWQSGDNAYLVTQDEEDLSDVDIFDITSPRRSRLVSELDLNDFDVAQPALNLADSNLHDMTVKCMTSGTYAGKCIMLASYWDGGYVLLDVTNPADPEFIYDTEYAAIHPELFEQTGIALTPEGNGHQAEFTVDTLGALLQAPGDARAVRRSEPGGQLHLPGGRAGDRNGGRQGVGHDPVRRLGIHPPLRRGDADGPRHLRDPRRWTRHTRRASATCPCTRWRRTRPTRASPTCPITRAGCVPSRSSARIRRTTAPASSSRWVATSLPRPGRQRPLGRGGHPGPEEPGRGAHSGERPRLRAVHLPRPVSASKNGGSASSGLSMSVTLRA